MKKRISLILSLVLLVSLAACGGAPAETTDGSGGTITVTDHAGAEVVLPEKIERIVVCDILPLPSVLCVFFDSADKLVGISGNSMSAAKNGLLGQL